MCIGWSLVLRATDVDATGIYKCHQWWRIDAYDDAKIEIIKIVTIRKQLNFKSEIQLLSGLNEIEISINLFA